VVGHHATFLLAGYKIEEMHCPNHMSWHSFLWTFSWRWCLTWENRENQSPTQRSSRGWV